MATIEERAKDYADNFVVGDAAIIVDLLHKVAEESYVNGATEQKAIDKKKADIACGNSYRNRYYDAIDEACEWLMQNNEKYRNKTTEDFIEGLHKVLGELI